MGTERKIKDDHQLPTVLENRMDTDKCKGKGDIMDFSLSMREREMPSENVLQTRKYKL